MGWWDDLDDNDLDWYDAVGWFEWDEDGGPVDAYEFMTGIGPERREPRPDKSADPGIRGALWRSRKQSVVGLDDRDLELLLAAEPTLVTRILAKRGKWTRDDLVAEKARRMSRRKGPSNGPGEAA